MYLARLFESAGVGFGGGEQRTKVPEVMLQIRDTIET
jgi:hypothetical protein